MKMETERKPAGLETEIGLAIRPLPTTNRSAAKTICRSVPSNASIEIALLDVVAVYVQHFPMFVPSLSRQMLGFEYKTAWKRTFSHLDV